MTSLAREIVAFVTSEFGRDEVLRRLSDPFWFQAFGCVLGFGERHGPPSVGAAGLAS